MGNCAKVCVRLHKHAEPRQVADAHEDEVPAGEAQQNLVATACIRLPGKVLAQAEDPRGYRRERIGQVSWQLIGGQSVAARPTTRSVHG
jgi:hypothetical protein